MKIFLVMLLCFGYASNVVAQAPANVRIRVSSISNDSTNSRVTFSWDAVAGISSYDVRIYTNPRILELEISRIITGATSFYVDISKNKMLPGTVIYLTSMGIPSPRRGSITVPTMVSTGSTTLSPYINYVLDTINIFRNPITNSLWPSVINVDSSMSNVTLVERVDPNNLQSFKIWVNSESNNDAVVVSPLECTLKSNARIVNVRWSPPLSTTNVNAITILPIAKAAALQLPVSVLKEMTKLSMERYLQRDSSWMSGKAIYTECFG